MNNNRPLEAFAFEPHQQQKAPGFTSIPILSVHYFGRAHLGKILGVYKIPYDVAASVAPLFTAWLYDVYGTYAVPERWNTAFAWVGLAVAAFALAGTPAHVDARAAAPLQARS